jgi:DNA-binding MarR family transcriptional regulator
MIAIVQGPFIQKLLSPRLTDRQRAEDNSRGGNEMNEKRQEPGVWSYCSNGALKRASRQLGQLYENILAPSGLRITQYTLLTQIKIGKETPLKQLAETMVMDLSALGHTLKPLLRDGLVELVPDAQDRRVKRVRLTDAGNDLWTKTNILWRDAQARFDAAFGKEASEALRQTMDLISSPDFARAFAMADDASEDVATANAQRTQR